MELKEMQNIVDQWIKKYGVRYFNELTNMAQLTEEVGEVARIISRVYGEQSVKKGQELGVLLSLENGKLSEAHFEIWKITSKGMHTENPASWLISR